MRPNDDPYPDEFPLCFNVFFFFNSRWDVRDLFRRDCNGCFISLTGGYFYLFWRCGWLSSYFRCCFCLGLWSGCGRRLSLSCCCGGTSFALLLDSYRIAPLDQVPQDLFRNLQGTIQFNHGLRGQDHIKKHVIAVTMMLDGVCQAAAPPLVYSDDLTVIVADDLLDTLQYSV